MRLGARLIRDAGQAAPVMVMRSEGGLYAGRTVDANVFQRRLLKSDRSPHPMSSCMVEEPINHRRLQNEARAYLEIHSGKGPRFHNYAC